MMCFTWLKVTAVSMNTELAFELAVYSLRYTVLTSPKKNETAVHGCSCWLFPSSNSY